MIPSFVIDHNARSNVGSSRSALFSTKESSRTNLYLWVLRAGEHEFVYTFFRANKVVLKKNIMRE